LKWIIINNFQEKEEQQRWW